MSGTAGNQRLLPANTTLLQPGSRFFRLSDSLNAQQAVNTQTQSFASSLNNVIETLRSEVATLQAQVAALQAITNALNYSTVEIATGTYFLDGRQIYRRSYTTTSNQTNTVVALAHGLGAFNYLVDAQGLLSQAGSGGYKLTFISLPQNPPTDALDYGSFWVDASNINIAIGNINRSSYVYIVTLWYTR